MSATTDEHQGHSHPYHLVDPSPWPAVGALAAFLLTFGVVLYLHPDLLGEGIEPMLTSLGALVFTPGVLLVVYTMFVWWRDVIREAEVEGHHSPVVQLGLRYGMALFICSEVMFFVAFFWAFRSFQKELRSRCHCCCCCCPSGRSVRLLGGWTR